MNLFRFKYIVFLSLLLSSCNLLNRATTIYSKVPKNKPYIVENKIERDDWKFSKEVANAVEQRLITQLEDSAKAIQPKKVFIFKYIKKPTAFDTSYSGQSAKNMEGSLFHLGYYNPTVTYKTDTANNKVTVTYKVTPGKPTLLDTIAYELKIPELQAIALGSLSESQIIKKTAVSKAAIGAEINRLVDSFKNNGYYKFTASEIKVQGDSSIEALTNISDDPFEQLRLLEEAQKKRDSPTVKIAFVLNKPEDSTSNKLTKYFINKIYVLSDYKQNDLLSDTVKIGTYITNKFTERYHFPLFKTSLLTRNITLQIGDVFRQTEYLNTLNNLNKLGVWQSVNIRLLDNLDFSDKVDIIIELIPSKKYSPFVSLESSYASNNSNTGNNIVGSNFFGLSLNVGLTNKNFAREAIRMTHNVRGGIELNNRNKSNTTNLINSNEISYSNNTVIPRRLFFAHQLNQLGFKKGESFLNGNISNSNRFNFFSLRSVGLNIGVNGINKKNNKLSFRIFSEYNNLYNKTQSFEDTLTNNPFLRYSYNTAFVGGLAVSYLSVRGAKKLINSNAKQIYFKFNVEFAGLIPILKEIRKNYIKIDLEFKKTTKYKKNMELAFRSFLGVGIPIKKDSALPFFKQYLGGGSNSMRGWPVRGIGRGGQALSPFGTSNFNDRTGDMQFETNLEFRHNIAPLIPNFLTLKGAAFIDAGNIWNLKSYNIATIDPSTIFKFKDAWKQIGISAGYGFRFDISYLSIRTDFSFRFKRPETSEFNNGWKSPDIGFNDAFRKIFSSEFREWRYENFNFTLGINYPF
jgi:outer membrane protein insertion porin family